MKIRNIVILLYFSFTTASAFGQTDKEDFNDFFYRFSTSRGFQIERILFPLEFVTWKNPEEIGSEITVKKISKDDWKHDYFFINQNYRPQVYDNFEGKLKDSDERLFQWIGVETGINVKYFFKRINEKWYLIKKENLGD